MDVGFVQDGAREEPQVGLRRRRTTRQAGATTQPNRTMPRISAISIYVHDIKLAEAFYRDLLGFAVAGRPAPFLVKLEHDGLALMLCAAERPASGQYSKDSATVLGIATNDVVGQADTLRAKGATVLFDQPRPERRGFPYKTSG